MKKNRMMAILSGILVLIAAAAFLPGASLYNKNQSTAANKASSETSASKDSKLAADTVKEVKPLKDIIAEKGIDTSKAPVSIVVDKSDHELSIFSGDVYLKSYHVELGDSGSGDKEIEGDHKTPEGKFYISEKSVLNPPDMYLGSRWLRISYPNVEDADRGLEKGLIDNDTHDEIVNAFNNKVTTPQSTALGGGVGIHGGSTSELGKDWTWGCVGLTNTDIEDFFDYVSVGTQLTIIS